jgi:hypothetical protein
MVDWQDGWSPSHRRLIKKLSIFFPFFRASTNHLGLAPLPAQVSPEGLRYVEPHHELIQCSK